MRYTVTKANGTKEYKNIPFDELSPEGQEFYHKINDKIKQISSGITISPIDVIVAKIEAAGFSVAEVTGRKLEIKFMPVSGKSNPKNPYSTGTIQNRKKINTNDAFRQFNDNQIDCLLINQSGSTGASAHAIVTDKVPANQVKQRCMIILQPELNVSTEVQKRGRINRTGQILKPIYDYVISAIPAENRLMMMLQKKLKSLDANTTSNQKQNKTIIDFADFLNKYGDKIVLDYMVEQTEDNKLWEIILEKLTKGDDDVSKIEVENLAHRVSGYVAMMDTKLQSAFYTEVSERYVGFVDYLKQVGNYDLEVETQPLEARTMDKKAVVIGNGGASVFGSDVFLEECEVNVLQKPFTKIEIDNIIQQSLEGKDAKVLQREMIEEYRQFLLVKNKEDEAKTRAEYGLKMSEAPENPNYKKALKANGGDHEKAFQEVVSMLQEAMEGRVKKDKEKAQYKYAYLQRLMNFFYVGRGCYFPNEFDTGLQPDSCVFTGWDIDKRKPNPYAPSSIRLRFAFTNSKKFIAMPLTKEVTAVIDSCIARSYNMSSQDQAGILLNWERYIKINSVNRNVRYIITGNLLKACADYKGKLISYTTNEQTTKKGILMPESFEKKDANGGKIVMSIAQAARVIISMTDGSGITTDEGFSIMRTFNNYRIAVGISRQKYGKFYMNERILGLTFKGMFEKVADKMVANIQLDNIKELITILNDVFGQSVSLNPGQFNQISKDIVIHEERKAESSPLLDLFTRLMLFKMNKVQLNGN